MKRKDTGTDKDPIHMLRCIAERSVDYFERNLVMAICIRIILRRKQCVTVSSKPLDNCWQEEGC